MPRSLRPLRNLPDDLQVGPDLTLLGAFQDEVLAGAGERALARDDGVLEMDRYRLAAAAAIERGVGGAEAGHLLAVGRNFEADEDTVPGGDQATGVGAAFDLTGGKRSAGHQQHSERDQHRE